MKKNLLIALAIVALSSYTSFSQNQIIWTDTFTTLIPSTSQQITNWNSFRALLVPTNNYTKVIIKGTFDTAGQTCTDSAIVNGLANSLYTNTDFYSTTSCMGNLWHNCSSHGYYGEVWLNPPSACSGSNCPTGYIIRPNITFSNPGNYNWGGVNTATCSAPTQRMTLIFEYGTLTSLNQINNTENISAFPNPFENQLSVNINNNEGGTVMLYNILGELVTSQHVGGGNSIINTTELKQGVYVICINTNNSTYTQKMVKQ